MRRFVQGSRRACSCGWQRSGWTEAIGEKGGDGAGGDAWDNVSAPELSASSLADTGMQCPVSGSKNLARLFFSSFYQRWRGMLRSKHAAVGKTWVARAQALPISLSLCSLVSLSDRQPCWRGPARLIAEGSMPGRIGPRTPHISPVPVASEAPLSPVGSSDNSPPASGSAPRGARPGPPRPPPLQARRLSRHSSAHWGCAISIHR